MLTLDKSSLLNFQSPTQQKTNHTPTARKAAYLGVPSYVHNSWLQKVQKQTTLQPTLSLFDAENQLLQSLFGSSSDANKTTILQFCNALRANSQGSLSKQNTILLGASTDLCKEQIAQTIFLAEKNLLQTISLIDLQDIPSSLKKIQTAFDAEIQNILTTIETRRQLHEKLQIQDPQQTVSIQKPLAIATLLITSTGFLNLGLIEAIKKNFFGDPSTLLRNEKDLIQTLDVIKRSPEIQQELAKVSKPTSPNFVSSDLIRISLGLAPTTVPTDRQAQTVALAALLSDMRQGDVGSCFATSVSILMMGTLKAKVISDFNEILSQGQLSRSSQTDQVDFVPVIDIGDSNIQKTLSILSNGRIVGTNAFLWQSPGIIAALRQLGIEGNTVEDVIKTEINQACTKSNKPSIELTIEELINQLIVKTQGKKLSSQEVADLKNVALVAFSAETNTPLLRTWESCFAAMAEANDRNNVRQRILSCISAPLSNEWPRELFRKTSPDVKKVQDVFQRILNSGIQLRYDEQVAVKASTTGGDGHSKLLGAFVLYELNQGQRATSAKRVSSPEEFNAFVLNRLKATQEIVNSITPATDSQRATYQRTIDKIGAFIAKPTSGFNSFLYKAITNYDPSNRTLSANLKNWEQLDHLPFQDATGNDNVVVFNKATGINAGQSDSVRPKDAQELLEAFIAFGRKRAHIDDFLNDEDPYQRYMVDTPQHAFTLTPEDATVLSAMKEDQTPESWIQQNIIQPGLKVSNLPLSNSQKSSLIALVKQNMIPDELQTGFDRAIQSLNARNSTVNTFARQLTSLILSISPRKDKAIVSYIQSNLTKLYLDNVLPNSAVKIITSSAARIADTNWVAEGVRHIYFACFFDPVSNTLQLGTLDEDGTGLNPLDQDEWVTYVPWEMYGVKLTPSMANHRASLINA